MPKRPEILRHVCADNDVEILYDKENEQFEIGVIEAGDWTIVGVSDFFRALESFGLSASEVPVKTAAAPVRPPDKEGTACRAPVKVQPDIPTDFAAMYFSNTNLPAFVSWLFYEVAHKFQIGNEPLSISFPECGGLTLFPGNWLVLDSYTGHLTVLDDAEMRDTYLEPM